MDARTRTYASAFTNSYTINLWVFFCLLFLGINCWNPAFDVTPASLITGGIVTEFGVFKPSELAEKLVPIVMSLHLEDPDHVNTGPDPS